MNMTPHMKKKYNSKVKNVKRAALIKYKLYCKGFSLTDIANDLHISNSAVHNSIYELSKVTRVDEWLSEKLGLEVVNG